MSSTPSTHPPFIWGTRAAGLLLCVLSWRLGGWAFLGLAWGALSLLRVPRRGLLVELAVASSLLLLVSSDGLPLVGAALSLLVIPLAPESHALPMNGVDRYFYLQDGPGTRMNSHHFVDMDAPLEREPLERALSAVLKEVPLARSFVREAPLGITRFVAKRSWVGPTELLSWADLPVEAEDSRALDAAMDLRHLPPWRVIHAPRPDGGFRLCLTVHHSAVDGEGGLLMLDLLVRRYNELRAGRPLTPQVPLHGGQRLRDQLRPRGLGWTLRMMGRHFSLGDQDKGASAVLADDAAARPTHTRHHLLRIPGDTWQRLKGVSTARGVSRNDLLVGAVFRAADSLRQARGAPDQRFRAFVPTNLRAALGIPSGLGNYLGMLQVVARPEEIRSSGLERQLSESIRSMRVLEESVGFMVNMGLVTLMPPGMFRAALRKNDADPSMFNYSLLVSTIRQPEELALPEGVGTERVLVRGSLTGRPCIGVVIIHAGGDVHGVVEYLSPTMRDETVREFGDRWLAEVERLASEPRALPVAS
ncbi:hypothetical protein [Myxococcus landrumensis]|uniref:Diacylglycerol O-acyltransferase n=1 Tax=Myxococcus landrumensis TaxID=2813577 RepID=A0ABX7N9H7_9BACT|nr:hypothetical protein [Myxococcus landrumus]QSQ15039.1 hypothetical protein JY572_02835 [Myxococcus landrumus]